MYNLCTIETALEEKLLHSIAKQKSFFIAKNQQNAYENVPHEIDLERDGEIFSKNYV